MTAYIEDTGGNPQLSPALTQFPELVLMQHTSSFAQHGCIDCLHQTDRGL